MARPFLKWVGGKRQLLPSLLSLLPAPLIAGRLSTYIEPFLGGGALFFHLADMDLGIQKAYLRDANPELILAYRVVQKKVDALITSLQRLEKKHLALSPDARREHFLQQRKKFNLEGRGFSFRHLNGDAIERAGLFIFLNRTGYNGLWRVNGKGEFNVPFGRYRQPRICDEEGLRQASHALKAKKAVIETGDYKDIETLADAATFIYYDPPYRPLTASSAFTAYTSRGFDDREQECLADLYRRMTQVGASQMLSNSAPAKSHPDHQFFARLYPGPSAHIHRVKARRSINSQGGGRGAIEEIVVTNF